MIEIKSKLNGTAIVLIDGQDIEDLPFHKIKSSLASVAPAISQLNYNNKQYHSLKNKISTLKANIDNKKLSDTEFRDFVKTLF